MSSISSGSSENILKIELELLSDENNRLKQKIDQLIRENLDLKSTIYNFNLKKNNPTINKTTGTNPFQFELKGHEGSIYTTKFSPCGRYLSSTSFDKTIMLWDIHSQNSISHLKGHEMGVLDGSWSDDSSLFVSCGLDGQCIVWNFEKKVYSISLGGFIQTCMFQPNSNEIFYCGNTKKFVYGIDSRQKGKIFTFENDSMVNSLLVQSNGNFMIGDHDGYIKTMDIKTMKLIHQHRVSEAPISHFYVYEKSLLTCSYDNRFRIFDKGFQSFQLLYEYTNPSQNWPIRCCRNSHLIASGSKDNCIKIYKGETVQSIQGHTDIVYSVDFHPTLPLLASCSADSLIKCWYFE